MFKLLLNNGANPNIQNKHSSTPLIEVTKMLTPDTLYTMDMLDLQRIKRLPCITKKKPGYRTMSDITPDTNDVVQPLSI